ncbi:hypothetical protein OF83DRAFT_1168476 [Amylostereum chailletii]|nr:hypothetical protein OF83DRAFT_1168476 [Amylostereum chailletii]
MVSKRQAARNAQEALSKLKYLPPLRQAKGKALAYIPTEIYLEILEYMLPTNEISEEESKAALDNLILVCHLFRALCLPHRLRRLKIVSTQKNHVNFIDGIIKYPYPMFSLRQYVRALTFSQWTSTSNDDNAWVYTQLLSKYALALDSFNNLSTLELDFVPITKEFWDSVAYVPVLENVSITRCSFEDASGPLPEDAPIKPWTSLVFHGNLEYTKYTDSLAALASSKHLATLKTDCWTSAQAILSRTPEFPALISLSIPIPPTPTFLKEFLSRTPSIESLGFPVHGDYRHRQDIPQLHLPAEALRKLTSLQCPSFFLDRFLPGRPIVSLDVIYTPYTTFGISVRDTEYILETHAILARVGTSLRTLTIPLSAIVRPGLPSLTWLDNLNALTLYVEAFGPSEDQLLMTAQFQMQINAHPSVHTVAMLPNPFSRETFDGHSIVNWALNKQEAWINSFLSPAFPNATFSFRHSIEWRRQANGVRIPVVLNKGSVKTSLTALAQKPPRHVPIVRDHSDCLRSLFREEELTGPLRVLLGVSQPIS